MIEGYVKNKKISGNMAESLISAIAGFLVILVAMINPSYAVSLAVFTLVVFALYKLFKKRVY